MRAPRSVSLVAWIFVALWGPLEPTQSHLVNQPVGVSMGSGVHPSALGRHRAAESCPCKAPGAADVGAEQGGDRSRSRTPGSKQWGVDKGGRGRDGGGSPLDSEGGGSAERGGAAPKDGDELARLFARHLAMRRSPSASKTNGGKGAGDGGGVAVEGARRGEAQAGHGVGSRGSDARAGPQRADARRSRSVGVEARSGSHASLQEAQGGKASKRASRAEALPPTPAERFRAQADDKGQTRVAQLHTEILDFVRVAQPHPHELDRRLQAVARLRELMGACIPGSDLELFGSLATGLPLPDSDVDLVAVSVPPAPDRNATAGGGRRQKSGIPELRRVAAALRSCDWVSHVKNIDTASVPVVKFKLNLMHPTWGAEVKRSEHEALRVTDDAGLVSVDISFFHSPGNSTQYVKRHLQQLRPLKPLVLVLKRLLRVHDLNDAYTGGLASHSIIMLLIFYLQNLGLGTQQRPSHAGLSPNAELGELLVNFLEYAAELKPGSWGLSLRQDQPFIKLDEGANFFLENPLVEGVNVARASFRMWQVQSAFRRARHLLLTEGTPLSVLLQTADWKRSEASGAPPSRESYYTSLAMRSKSCDEGGLASRLPSSSSPSQSEEGDDASHGRQEHHAELRQKPSLVSPSASEDAEDAHVHHAQQQQQRGACRHSVGARADSEHARYAQQRQPPKLRSASLASYDERGAANPALSGRAHAPQADVQARPQQQHQHRPRAQNAGGGKGQATHTKRPSSRQRGVARAPRAQSEPLGNARFPNGRLRPRSVTARKRSGKARDARDAGGVGWTADTRQSGGRGGHGGAGREGAESSGALLWSDIVKRTLPTQPPEDPPSE